MRTKILIAMAFSALNLAGCGGNAVDRTGTYISTVNSAGAVIVTQLVMPATAYDPDGTFNGNTYATQADARAAIAKGYSQDAGAFTGRVSAMWFYTDRDAESHANNFAFTLQFEDADGNPVGDREQAFAHFDDAGNFIVQDIAGRQDTISGTWVKQ